MESADIRRIVVMGAGAIGKLVTAGLLRAGCEVRLLARRPEQARSLRDNGLVVIRPDGEEIVLPVAATTDMPADCVDLVILAVKSFDTEQAARQIARMPGTPAVLSLQNGLGNGEALAAALGAERVLLGLATYGATSLSDHKVAARGEGEFVLGGYGGNHPAAGKLSALFAEAGWKVRIGEDMRKEVWKKALVNIGINPVTAIYRVTNGEILERPELRETAVAAVKEAGRVAQALGVLGEAEAAEGVGRMLQVCEQTAANRSSMLQDVEKGRRTEIDSLNGAVVRLGQELSVETPVNRELARRVANIGGCL